MLKPLGNINTVTDNVIFANIKSLLTFGCILSVVTKLMTHILKHFTCESSVEQYCIVMIVEGKYVCSTVMEGNISQATIVVVAQMLYSLRPSDLSVANICSSYKVTSMFK